MFQRYIASEYTQNCIFVFAIGGKHCKALDKISFSNLVTAVEFSIPSDRVNLPVRFAILTAMFDLYNLKHYSIFFNIFLRINGNRRFKYFNMFENIKYTE